MQNIYEIIFLIASFLYLLLAFFLFTHKKGNRQSNRIFAGFLSIKAFILINYMCYFHHRLVYNFSPVIYLLVNSFFFLVGPFLYFYTKSVTRTTFTFKKIHVLHFIPSILDLALRSHKYVTNPNIKDELINTGTFLTRSELYVGSMLINIHVFSYILASLAVLKIYQSEIKKVFSSIERINLSWLKLILFGFLFFQLFDFSKDISLIVTGFYPGFIGIGKHLGPLVLATIIVIKSLRQPEIFSGIHYRPKYEKSSLKKSDQEKHVKTLIAHMKSEKPYLNPTLTLYELAERISLQPRYLSQILNESLHQNFHDFVNAYRIQAAKRLLADNASTKKTVLEILYEAGFNSKSSFNNVFKKHTGMTPVQFRRMHHSRKAR